MLMKAFRLMGVHQPESFYFALSSGELFCYVLWALELAGLHASGSGAPSFRKLFALGWRLLGSFG